MNPYEQKQEQRRARLLAAAERSKARAEARFTRARQILDPIPPGQPVLVGHHSETRHRRALRLADANMRRAFEAQERARELAGRAASVGRGGISSDDPDAVAKLDEKHEDLGATLARWKAVNAAWRKAGRPTPDSGAGWERVAALLGVPLADLRGARCNQASNASVGDPAPYASFEVRNLAQRVRATTDRRARLEESREAPPREEVRGPGWLLYDDADDNRTTVKLDARPDPVRKAGLRAAGFRYSPTRGAWVRHRSNGAWYAALRCLRGAE